jgi:hypothetical protein
MPPRNAGTNQELQASIRGHDYGPESNHKLSAALPSGVRFGTDITFTLVHSGRTGVRCCLLTASPIQRPPRPVHARDSETTPHSLSARHHPASMRPRSPCTRLSHRPCVQHGTRRN